MLVQLNSISKGVLAVACLATLASLGSAQRWNRRPDPFNTTMEGRGSVHFNGTTYSFHQLQVTLQRNDRLTVHALLYAGDGRDVVLSGKVNDFGRRTGRLSADIDSIGYGRDNDSADAMCDIDMTSADRFNTVTITGQNTTDHNGLSLDFVSNGRVVTDFQRPNNDRIYDNRKWDNRRGDNRDRDRDRNGDRDREDNRGGYAAGRYTDSDQWRRHGDSFLVRYTLDMRPNGQVRLVADGQDRNMPDDRDSRYDHGDILKYLQHGDNVVETGHWTQDGNRITITFDWIQYGDTSRSKKEVWHGQMRNGTLWIDDYEKSFYGHDVQLSFEPSR